MLSILGLTLWLMLLGEGTTYPPLRPKFLQPPMHPGIQVFNQYNSGSSIWYPAIPTLLFQLPGKSKFLLEAMVDNVFDGNLEFFIQYSCERDGDFVRITEQISFCNGHRQISFGIAWVKRISISRIRFLFMIEPSAMYDESNPTDHLNFKLSVREAKYDNWVNSNRIYLYKWNFLPAFTKTGIFVRRTIDILTEFKLDSTKGFDTDQFLTEEAMSLLLRLPAFFKSFVSANLVLQFNIGAFQEDHIFLNIGTQNDLRQWNPFETNLRTVARADFRTGTIQYSPRGLLSAAAYLLGLSRGSHMCLHHSDCVLVTGCSVLLNALFNETITCLDKDFLIYKKVRKSIITAANSYVAPSECNVMDGYEKNVKIFAGFPNIVLCPIICSDLNEIYGFYKGKTPLLADQNPNKWFTSYGAVKIHQSTVAIQFEAFATNEDSGDYMCVAGGKQAQFRIEIVALPSFHVPNSAWVGGHLPQRIYVHQGDEYSVSCTVYHSGLKPVTIKPEFFVASKETPNSFHQVDQSKFIQIWQSEGDLGNMKLNIDVVSTATSTTLTLSVKSVPPPSKHFDFHHRFTCTAELGNDHSIGYFGFPEYKIESGTDVLVLQEPSLNDFVTTHSMCCRNKCINEKCKVEVMLNPSVHSYLKSIGIRVHAEFSAPIALQQKSLMDWIKDQSVFDAENARLTWQMDKGVEQLQEESKAILFPNLIALFRYTNPLANSTGLPHKLSIKRRRHTSSEMNRNIAKDCLSDPSCVYSVAFDDKISKTLMVATQLAISAKKIEDLTDYLAAQPSSFNESGLNQVTHVTLTEIQKRFVELMQQSDNNSSYQLCVPNMFVIGIGLICVTMCFWFDTFIAFIAFSR